MKKLGWTPELMSQKEKRTGWAGCKGSGQKATKQAGGHRQVNRADRSSISLVWAHTDRVEETHEGLKAEDQTGKQL